LTDFNSSIIVLIILIDTRFIGTTFIDIHKARLTISTNRFVEETLGSLGIPLGGE